MLILAFAKRLGKRVKEIQELAQYFNMKLGKAKSNYIDANTMTREVKVYASALTSDGQGGYTTTFTLQSTIWGDLRPDNQNRAIGEGRLEFDRSNVLYIRYGVTISDNYQLEIDSVRYTIHSITDVENQNRFLEIVIYS
jgi:SPP1 family predicted phage head-tail adaptor